MPLQPAYRDHHTLPPPGRKTTGSGRVRASLAHEPPQQAAQAILRQAPAGAWPGGLLGCEPEPVTFAEDQPLDAGPVACPERRWNEGDRVYDVEAARGVEREQVARPERRCELETPPVRRAVAA